MTAYTPTFHLPVRLAGMGGPSPALLTLPSTQSLGTPGLRVAPGREWMWCLCLSLAPPGLRALLGLSESVKKVLAGTRDSGLE